MTNDDFVYNYFIFPILSKTGYNPINTIVYAIVAILAIYIIWQIFKIKKIALDKTFIYGVLTFVLFGSTVRVVTDAIDSGIFRPISPLHELVLSSHIYDYGFLTVSPGIYLVTAVLLFVTMGILHLIKKPELLAYVGLVLWFPHFLLLVPFMNYAMYAIPVLILAAIPAIVAWKYFNNEIFTLVVAGQALDGAATFFVIDVFGPMTGKPYFEQHVVGGFIGAFFGTYFAFYLMKVIIAWIAASLLQKEKEELALQYFIALVIMIMGFAPGIRDMLRMMVGA